MAGVQSGPNNLGVLMIDFSPVVRDGLQAILSKGQEIEALGDAKISMMLALDMPP